MSDPQTNGQPTKLTTLTKNTDEKILEKNTLLILASIGVGYFSSEYCVTYHNALGLIALMPLLWLETENKPSSLLVPFAYYLAFTRGILQNSYLFFDDESLIRSFTLWVLSAFALSLPYGIPGRKNGKRYPAKTPLGITLSLVFSIVLPMGLIGWGNPLIAAGLFFPSLGWLGLTLMLAVYIAAAQSEVFRRNVIVLILFLVPFSPLFPVPNKTIIKGITIQSVDTKFGRMASGSGDSKTQYEREQNIFRYLYTKDKNGEFASADIVILPETIIGDMFSFTMRKWEKALSRFTERGTIFIIGGEIYLGSKYDNVMVSFEKDGKRQLAKQSIPVPYSMYRPFANTGSNGYPFSFGKLSCMEIYGIKLSFAICYEQAIVWPLIGIALQKPDIVAAPSNTWWCKGSSLEGIQTANLFLWTRLFNIPMITARNS